jgi:hypothetical protein
MLTEVHMRRCHKLGRSDMPDLRRGNHRRQFKIKPWLHRSHDSARARVLCWKSSLCNPPETNISVVYLEPYYDKTVVLPKRK